MTRRTRSPHPGVVLIPPDPDGRHPTWRARYTDPDTDRTTKERIDPVSVRTDAARRDWAIRKSKANARRRLELEGGAPRATGTGLAAAVDRYFEDHKHLRERTRWLYRRAADQFLAWARRAGVDSADDVTRERLAAFRASRVREGIRAPKAKGKRGERGKGEAARAAGTINVEIRSARTVLGYLRKLGLLPRITTDDLRDGLERLRVTTERIEHLPPPAIRKLLAACLRHDAERFSETREERELQPAHDSRKGIGATQRYPSIAPFVAAVLLSGMRLGEAAGLDWNRVDLEVQDHEGRPVGEIRLRGSDTKTNKPRDVDLAVSPALRRLLAALRLRSGGEGSVFGLTEGEARASERRLVQRYGAPEAFGWQALRQTCGTYLTNAPGIFGAASAYRSARQLGHSVAVAEKHYLGVAKGIPPTARTLEDAMGIAVELESIIGAVSTRAPRQRRARRRKAG